MMKSLLKSVTVILICLGLLLAAACAAEGTVTATIQPTSVTVREGQMASLKVSATGEGLTYAWYYKDAGASGFTRTASFGGNNYDVAMNEARSGRQVYCVVTDKYGNSAKTAVATLNMDERVYITAQPKSVTVAEGETASVTVKATGKGLKYEWYFKNQGTSKFVKTSAFTGNTYKVTMDETRAGRQVYCVVSDSAGNSVKSSVATLAMESRVTIVTHPKSVTVREGQMADLSVQAQGDGLTYAWFYKDAGATGFVRTYTFGGNHYGVVMNDYRAGRQVYCVVSDQYGNSAKSSVATLNMDDSVYITAQPQSVTVAAGETAAATVKATGKGLTYEWYFNNAGTSKFVKTTAFTGNTYKVTMDETRAGRRVYCVVTDSEGNSVKSSVATLNMIRPVSITAQPEDVYAAEGETVDIRVTAQGEGLTYRWYYKDAGADSYSLTKTFTGNFYSVVMNDVRAGRKVYCKVTDKYGNSVNTRAATLNMLYPAEITAQPEDATAYEGGVASVTVKATGSGLKYAWYFRNAGTNSFARTNSFTGNTYKVAMNADRADRQIYCVVSDSLGNSVKSDVVTLRMIAKPEISLQPEDVYVDSGSTASVSITATGSGLSAVWYVRDPGKESFSKSDVTGFEYSAVINESNSGRQVYCAVTDRLGTTVKSDVVTLRVRTNVRITSEPDQTQITCELGETISLTIEAEGDGLEYYWYYADVDMYYYSRDYGVTGNTYTAVLTKDNAGRQIFCRICDRYGNWDESSVFTMKSSTPVGDHDSARSEQVVEIVNEERAAEGLDILTVSNELTRAARIRAEEISTYYSHTRPDGSSCFTVSPDVYGENIAYGFSSSKSVMDAWMNSQGHRENIMRSGYKTIGVGCFCSYGVYYWVQVFGYY